MNISPIPDADAMPGTPSVVHLQEVLALDGTSSD